MNKKHTALSLAFLVFVGVSALSGCSKKEESLISAAAAPAGYAWESVKLDNVGDYQLPKGEGWQRDGLGTENETKNLTVSVQLQGGVESGARGEYMKALIDVNKRDAPKYEVVAQKEGQIAGKPAGRVDGKFDNGTAYATRDYVLFVKNVALAVMVRGPIANKADVESLADYVASSYK
jgi:hypothetical protein